MSLQWTVRQISIPCDVLSGLLPAVLKVTNQVASVPPRLVDCEQQVTFVLLLPTGWCHWQSVDACKKCLNMDVTENSLVTMRHVSRSYNANCVSIAWTTMGRTWESFVLDIAARGVKQVSFTILLHSSPVVGFFNNWYWNHPIYLSPFVY